MLSQNILRGIFAILIVVSQTLAEDPQEEVVIGEEETVKDEIKPREKFIRVPEDIVAQNEFITNSEISLGVDLPFSADDEFVEVSSHFGKIKGFRDISSKGKSFYSFLGIPYAKPPINSLRFKEPEFPEKWEETLDASAQPSPCSQINLSEFLTKMNPSYEGSEDCLHLNIFTPKPNMSLAELPVLVYIHGGQYVSGNAKDYKPHYLLNEEVVLVVIQYRLGIFGFLSTEDDILPGNLGLKDQTKALLWIQRNIEFFGGSPLKVTLIGSDAGAASVHFQILSHYTIGLFSRAIMQSGNALCPWALGGAHKEVAHHIGRKMNCKPFSETVVDSKTTNDKNTIEEGQLDESDEQLEEDDRESTEQNNEEEKNQKEENDYTVDNISTEDPENVKLTSGELLDCLQKVDAEELTMLVDDYFMWNTLPTIFGPYIDGNFIPASPENLLTEMRHKRLDMIIGINRDEGSFLTASAFASEGRRYALKSHFPLVGPISLEFSDEDLAPLNLTIKAYDQYIQGADLEIEKADDITKMFGDRHYSVCSDLAAIIHADNNIQRKKNIFFYELHHRGAESTIDNFALKFGKDWISHGDELQYLFPTTTEANDQRSEADSNLTDIMTNLWRNYANNGNPNNETFGFTWEPFTSSDRKHLNLMTEPKMENDNREEVREFWTSLPTKQNVILFKDKFHQKLPENEDLSKQKDEL